MFQAENLVVSCSTSGKCTKSHVRLYHKDVLGPELKTHTPQILIQDSWGGQKDEQMIKESLPDNVELKIETLPKHTTGYFQPLDRQCFRQLKNLMTTIQDNALTLKTKTRFYQRNNIIKFNSLCMNQMSSPRYRSLILYAWFDCKYLAKRPAPYVTPCEYSFKSKARGQKCAQNCSKAVFIRCGWCSEFLCFNHFFEQYHYCEKYVP